jgi:hypothetical protein
MNTLGKLPLTVYELRTIPTLYYNSRIVGVNLLRQYTNESSQENGETSNKNTKKFYFFLKNKNDYDILLKIRFFLIFCKSFYHSYT